MVVKVFFPSDFKNFFAYCEGLLEIILWYGVLFYSIEDYFRLLDSIKKKTGITSQRLNPVSFTWCPYIVIKWLHDVQFLLISLLALSPSKTIKVPSPTWHPTTTSICWENFLNPAWVMLSIWRKRKYGFNEITSHLTVQDSQQHLCGSCFKLVEPGCEVVT